MDINEKINQLTLIEQYIIKNKHNINEKRGIFLCDICKNKKDIRIYDVEHNKSKNCGCDKMVKMANKRRKHGESYKSRLYNIWKGMKKRCYNKNDSSYKDYGKKGVIVCDIWKEDYLLFKKWALDNGYKENLTIERINPNLNYEPSNCMWIIKSDQKDNQRKSIRITAFGETKTIKQWLNDDKCLIKNRTVIGSRIRLGWNGEKALTTPRNCKLPK